MSKKLQCELIGETIFLNQHTFFNRLFWQSVGIIIFNKLVIINLYYSLRIIKHPFE